MPRLLAPPQVEARRWPTGLALESVRDARTGGFAVAPNTDFVLELRPGDFTWIGPLGRPLADPVAGARGAEWIFLVLVPPLPTSAAPARHDSRSVGALRLPTIRLPVGYRRRPRLQQAWEWDGDPDRPTLHPSIRSLAAPVWHGWLQRGILTTE